MEPQPICPAHTGSRWRDGWGFEEGWGQIMGRGGWLWHWLHHLVCWKECAVVNAKTCCWLMPPGHIAEMARMTLVGNAALTMEAPTGNPRLPCLFSSSLSHTQIHGRSEYQLVLLSLRWDLQGIPLPIFKCSYIQIPLWNEKAIFSSSLLIEMHPHTHFHLQCQHIQYYAVLVLSVKTHSWHSHSQHMNLKG